MQQELTIKGPGGKLKYTARRFWECPSCRRKEWTPGHVTSRRCRCVRGGDPDRQFQMKLVEEQRRARSAYPDPERMAAALTPPAAAIAAATAAAAAQQAAEATAPKLPDPEPQADVAPAPEPDTTKSDTHVPENGETPPV